MATNPEIRLLKCLILPGELINYFYLNFLSELFSILPVPKFIGAVDIQTESDRTLYVTFELWYDILRSAVN